MLDLRLSCASVRRRHGLRLQILRRNYQLTVQAQRQRRLHCHAQLVAWILLMLHFETITDFCVLWQMRKYLDDMMPIGNLVCVNPQWIGKCCLQKYSLTASMMKSNQPLVTFCTNAVLAPPAFVGTISSGKWWSLNHCSGCTTKTRRAGLLNARSQFPSSTRANTTVDLNSAWFNKFKFPVNRATWAPWLARTIPFAIVFCWLRLHNR